MKPAVGGRRHSALAARLPAALLLIVLPLAAVFGGQDHDRRAPRLIEPAQRVVSLSPHLTELLFAIGAGEQIVGAMAYSDYPPAARRIPRIGSHGALDVERILGLRPDLLVAWGSGNRGAALAQLRDAGVPVFSSEPKRLADIAGALRELGVLTGRRVQAERQAHAFLSRLRRLQARYSDRPPVKVFYQLWSQPLMTVGGPQMISRVIRLCGGRNVFAQLGTLAAPVALEAVLIADPEVIVAGTPAATRFVWADRWRHWPDVLAVRRDNLHWLDPDRMQRHTPRLLDAAQALCGLLEAARVKRPPVRQ